MLSIAAPARQTYYSGLPPAYTREQATSYIMELFKHQQMNEVYYSFLNNLSEDVFDNNSRLKKIIREKGEY